MRKNGGIRSTFAASISRPRGPVFGANGENPPETAALTSSVLGRDLELSLTHARLGDSTATAILLGSKLEVAGGGGRV